MPTHWTYESCDSASDLEQGDILKPSEELRGLFAQVHPHFDNEKYLGYLVATQSCDLVRRKDEVKASYVSLVVIRPLAQVLPKLISTVASAIAPGLFATSSKSDARRLLERILNQNEQTLGLFFLYQDSDIGIGEPSVCFLRVAVSLRREHYSKLLAARTGRITPEFRAKLGWLLGNLYSRPATPDWHDKPGGKETLAQLISQCLEEQIPDSGPRWIDDEIVREGRKQGIDFSQAKIEDLEGLRPKPQHERAVDEIKTELSRLAMGIPTEKLMAIEHQLHEIRMSLSKLDADVSKEELQKVQDYVDKIQAEISKPEIGLPVEQLKKLENRLRNSGRFKNLFKAIP